MPTQIKISSAAFNEFAAAMEKLGRKQGVNAGIITLEKDDLIVDPVDWRAATVRKDCLAGAVQLKDATTENITETTEKLFNFVITGKLEKE